MREMERGRGPERAEARAKGGRGRERKGRWRDEGGTEEGRTGVEGSRGAGSRGGGEEGRRRGEGYLAVDAADVESRLEARLEVRLHHLRESEGKQGKRREGRVS